MSTKSKPGPFDCYGKLLPDEPYFVLMARDPMAPIYVRRWAIERLANGPGPDDVQASDALVCAVTMIEWREANVNFGSIPTWRRPETAKAAPIGSFNPAMVTIPLSDYVERTKYKKAHDLLIEAATEFLLMSNRYHDIHAEIQRRL